MAFPKDNGTGVFAIPPTTDTVTIPATAADGQSTQFLINGRFTGLYLPAAWTTAAISFLTSADDVVWAPVYDIASGASTKTERSLAATAVAATGSVYFLNLGLNDWTGCIYLKLRSGLQGAAVQQAADRVFTVVRN